MTEPVQVELDPQFVQRYLHGPEVRENLERRLEVGAEFWRTNARKRTGYMAEQVHGSVIDGSRGFEGLLEMTAEYAKYQEQGFHHHGGGYVEGMHLMQDILALMSEDPS
ncbi:hypothetical protein K8O93_01165 [Gordonia bronchialis]|uniref:hypothetical protein n=1 Tax=Gordonia bronchialis TaxID=2054 RepID=UPI001CC1AC6E|nr:hypothetical protein [Gordonia bronchialis]UAK38444.1 hypothetical protein K8O93_01165 [Gordonia bronchialis]